MYDYGCKETMLVWDWIYDHWDETNFDFLAMSPGPDLRINFPWGTSSELYNLQNGSAFFIYDPTNGSISEGDVIRTNHGQH